MSLRGEFKRLKRRLHRAREGAYAAADAARIRRRAGRKLFIDGGSNVGQGFTWFSRRFHDADIDFHLFEPNPNCQPSLERLRDGTARPVTLHPQAIGVGAGVLKFYGLADTEGGQLSQGGSLLKSHNSSAYAPDEAAAIEVPVIDFPAYLQTQAETYDTIVVKMDIEGAEIDLLQAIIDRGVHRLIDTLYVEFHAQYQAEPMRSETRQKELALIARLRKLGVRVRIWH